MGPIDSIERHYQRYRRNRSPRELSAVFTELNPHLLATAMRSGLDQSGAEDVVQETFLASIRGHERFDEDRPFVPWVRGILDRQIKAERRRRARLRALSAHEDGAEATACVMEDASEGAMARAELRAKLRTAIDSLNERNAPVVAAALLEGQSVGVIASRLGITKSAVAVRLHRGLRQVRERLGERSSLALLAWTLPKHGEVLPGVLPGGALGSAILSTASLGVVWKVAGALMVFALGLWALRVDGDRANSPERTDLVGRVETDAGVVIASELGPRATAPIALAARPGARAVLESAALPEEVAVEASHLEVIGGSVVSEGGGPVPAGVEIYLLETRPELVLPTEPMRPAAIADVKGRFELDASALTGDFTPIVMARAPGLVGYVDLLSDHRSEGRVPEIELHADVKIILNITDEDGAPVEGVAISGMTDSTRFQAPVGPIAEEFGYIAVDPYHHLFGATTDEAGRGVIEGLFGHGGQGLLLVFSATKAGYGRCTEAFLQDDGHDLEVDIVLRRTRDLVLEGTVFDESSQPLPGAEVRFRARGEAPLSDAVVARTDGAGRWSIPPALLDEYPIFLSISKPGFGVQEMIFEGPERLDGAAVETSLRRSAPLVGRVVDESGNGVAGVRVEVTTRSHSRELETDKSGAFVASGLTREPRHVRAIGSVAKGPLRSIQVAADAESESVTVVLASSPVIPSVAVHHADGVALKRVELIPLAVASTIEPVQAEEIEGATATFTDVYAGEWLAAAMTEEDLTCFRVIRLEAGAVEPVFELETEVFGGVDVWIGEPGEDMDGGLTSGPIRRGGADALGVEPGLFVARRIGFPGLPPWLDQATTVPLAMFYSQVTPGRALEVGRMIPGTWEVVASGPGWTIEPQRIEIGPGEVVSLELAAQPALPVQVSIGPIHRSARLLFECRKTENDPWVLVSLWSLATGQGQDESLWLAPGTWSWRATVAATNDYGEWFELMPALEGELLLAQGEGGSLELWP